MKTMKKKLFLILLIGLMFLPFGVKAKEKEYNTLDFKEALADEDIAEEFKNYNPSSDAITIYLFRGKGCGYCRAFLTFMNSITDEYGKYFKMESYEVWNDADNAALMTKVSEYLDNPAGGVPYIVIGDKVFAGYASEYDAGIKQAITDLYNTKKAKRYDVFTEMKKHPKKNNTSTELIGNSTLLWIFAMLLVATGITVSYISLKFKELNAKLDGLQISKNTNNHKETTKKSQNKKK